MVAPVTGPFIETVGGTGLVTYFRYKSGYKQSRPFDLPLAYDFRTGSCSRTGTHTYDARTLAAGFDMIQQVGMWDTWTHLENAAYDKFKSHVSDQASLGVSLAEIGQSYSMISTRAAQILGFARRLSRLDFAGAARVLQMSSTPKGVSTKKSFSRNYLEYHFGWSPLIGDMYNVAEVLQTPIKSVKVHVMVGDPSKRYDLSTPSKGSNPAAWYPSNLTWDQHRYWHGARKVYCGAELFVSNPNLWLANQLGLVNPAVIAWELVPYSFVVDWFANVGQVLQSFTDFYGLTLSKEWTTRVFKGQASFRDAVTYRWQEWGGNPFGLQTYYSSNTKTCVGPFTHMRRQTGLPSPRFAVRPYKAPGLRRALAAVSLLTLQLRGR